MRYFLAEVAAHLAEVVSVPLHLGPTMIDSLAGFLQHNLIVLLAVVLVPMKLAILRLCGDDEAQRAAFLSIPEDLVYVSLGLVLGDFATLGGAFRHHFAGSRQMTMALSVTVALGIMVAVGVHVLSKWTSDQVRSWQAASQVALRPTSTHPDQADLGLHTVDPNVRLIQTRHIALSAILYLLQLCITIRWLAWIAQVLANG